MTRPRSFGGQGEVVGGRVDISDMKNWIIELKSGANPFTNEEVDGFVNMHLINHVTESYRNGLDEEAASETLLSEISKGGNNPKPSGMDHLKEIVQKTYKIIKEKK